MLCLALIGPVMTEKKKDVKSLQTDRLSEMLSLGSVELND